LDPALTTKSGVMVGLGEEMHELLAVYHDLANVGVDVLTVGQYLRPSKDHLPMARYYTPDEFAYMKREALAMGFRHVESGPLVRSSYHAHEQAYAAAVTCAQSINSNSFGGFLRMKEARDSITRRQALARIGGAALGSALAPSLMQAQGATPAQTVQRHALAGKSGKRPNILWITGEGVPLSVLSCYGSRLMKTPNIDRIANEGLRFTNSFCTNALCAPSRATLLTGKYNHLNGM